MKILIEVHVDRAVGKNLSGGTVGEHICDNLVAPGEDRHGNIFVDNGSGNSTEYEIKLAKVVGAE